MTEKILYIDFLTFQVIPGGISTKLYVPWLMSLSLFFAAVSLTIAATIFALAAALIPYA